jgi:hypothetical protein
VASGKAFRGKDMNKDRGKPFPWEKLPDSGLSPEGAVKERRKEMSTGTTIITTTPHTTRACLARDALVYPVITQAHFFQRSGKVMSFCGGKDGECCSELYTSSRVFTYFPERRERKRKTWEQTKKKGGKKKKKAKPKQKG